MPELEAVLSPAAPGGPSYRVHEAVVGATYQPGPALYESANFLETADFAFEYLEREQPLALEIQRSAGGAFETVWTYSEARADARAARR
jgi:hypothetical protein